ncbi:8104_t:CDS:2 [Acaulospora morrowiae]|uniref:8104_t:CDS:1 n=1 Tax=Acaulospora morrowiae TaxID=94023 RepID=A0A9N8VW64_9GLOM|nr:8104_t:CDS:2 [Acaulospora morrowiae]
MGGEKFKRIRIKFLNVEKDFQFVEGNTPECIEKTIIVSFGFSKFVLLDNGFIISIEYCSFEDGKPMGAPKEAQLAPASLSAGGRRNKRSRKKACENCVLSKKRCIMGPGGVQCKRCEVKNCECLLPAHL